LSHHIATKSTVALHVGTMWPLFVLSNYWCFISQVLMAMDCKQLSLLSTKYSNNCWLLFL